MPGNTDLRYHISRLNKNPQHISCRVCLVIMSRLFTCQNHLSLLQRNRVLRDADPFGHQPTYVAAEAIFRMYELEESYYYAANNKGNEQTVHMRRLICGFVVCITRITCLLLACHSLVSRHFRFVIFGS